MPHQSTSEIPGFERASNPVVKEQGLRRKRWKTFLDNAKIEVGFQKRFDIFMTKLSDKKVVKRGARDRILDGASVIFAEQGYAAASISKIAKKAGVLPGSIYWAFESKEQIFIEVLKRASMRWKEEFISDENVEILNIEGYTKYFLSLAIAFEKAPEFLRLIMIVAIERQMDSPETLAAAQGVRRFWRTEIEQLLKKLLGARDPKALDSFCQRLSRLTIQMLDGIFLSNQLEPNEASVREMISDVANVLGNEIELGANTLPKI